MEPRGRLLLMLHAHLPFVRHPEHERFLEEEWLFEAITETYLPLLALMEGWEADRVPYALTMSLTPPLVAMLEDRLLMERYVAHLDLLIELAEKEVARTGTDPAVAPVAADYLWRFTDARHRFVERYQHRLVPAFAALAAQGNLEIIASAATHGFLPMLTPTPSAVRAQLAIGVDQYEQTFGRKPRGFWLPECGFQPGIEEELARLGIEYFFGDAHALLHAAPRPRYGVYAPARSAAGPTLFCRDLDASTAVWSAKVGYPGDPCYRDFYRDIGFDLPLDYIGPYIQPTGHRKMTGIKYHRITDRDDSKEWYDPAEARARVGDHVDDFIARRIHRVVELEEPMGGRPPVIVAPFDAELFGHWWYEGPEFLNLLFRKLADAEPHLAPTTPSRWLAAHPDLQTVAPAASSWGEQGYAAVWVDESNDWIYRHLHRAADRMTMLADRYAAGTERWRTRLLNQAGRELLLAQSSDWAFIIKNGTTAEYAERRVREHLKRFNQLCSMAEESEFDDELFLANLEDRDNLFASLDYRCWSTPDRQPVI